MMRIGVDLGGTKTQIVVLGKDHEVLFGRRVPTPGGNYEAIVENIKNLVLAAESELGVRATIGVGIPGSPSVRSGLIRNANTTCLNGRDLCGDLRVSLGREIRVANDANCFALSEATDGSGEGESVVFGVIIGTGCGGGVVVNGKVLEGCNGVAGEWGHTQLPWLSREENQGIRCYCGLADCTETFLSGPGWSSRYNRRYGTNLSAAELVARAEEEDEEAVSYLRLYADWLARGLASVINLLDPNVVVLGGGLSNIKCLYELVPRLLPQYVFSDAVSTKILPPKFGDASGVRGAAWLW